MKLARYRREGAIAFGAVDGGSVSEFLVADSATRDPLQDYLAGHRSQPRTLELQEVEILAPVARPDKIICVGLNYLDHCRETATEPPATPVLFPKYPNTVVGPGASIRIPEGESAQVDFEAELVVIIGKTCSQVPVDQALDHVLGYCAGNDVSARDVQFETSQWLRGKSFDTFLPLGPYVVTQDEVGDPQDLGIRCWVNDQLYQDSSTREMIFPVARLVSHISRTITLEPGDVIATGTPWGVGFVREPPVFLGDGDVVTVEIDGVGRLSNPVEIRSAGPATLAATAG